MTSFLELPAYFYCHRRRILTDYQDRLSGVLAECEDVFRIGFGVIGWGILTVLVLLALWLMVFINVSIEAVKKQLVVWLDEAIFCLLDSEDFE